MPSPVYHTLGTGGGFSWPELPYAGVVSARLMDKHPMRATKARLCRRNFCAGLDTGDIRASLSSNGCMCDAAEA